MPELCEFLKPLELAEFSSDRVRKILKKTDRMAIEMICYKKGQSTVIHKHPKQDELFFVLKGEGVFLVDDQEKTVSEGTLIYVPAGSEHGIMANLSEEFIVYFIKAPNKTTDPS
ncbi:MAG: cupin domain-containing protein [Clostridia bacterium]|nr:cupin domain-containing protein [Clostridia bacterium]